MSILVAMICLMAVSGVVCLVEWIGELSGECDNEDGGRGGDE